MNIGLILLQVLALFMALTFHEFAHGWIAKRLGDRTAEAQGRLTLNPKDHIDPVGVENGLGDSIGKEKGPGFAGVKNAVGVARLYLQSGQIAAKQLATNFRS